MNIFVELHPVYAAKLEQVKQSGNLPALFEQWIMGLEEEDFSVEIRRTKTKNIERYQGEVIGWQVLVGQHTRPEYAAKLEQVKQSGNLPALFEQWIMALQDDSFSH